MALLRESGRMAGTGAEFEVELSGESARAPASVAGGTELGDLVDAAMARDEAALERAREAVIDVLGVPALIDAAAVLGNFQRMVRIADGTGIPLDEPVQAMTADLRGPLGIDDFRSARNTPKVSLFRRPVHWLLRRMVRGMVERQTNAGAPAE